MKNGKFEAIPLYCYYHFPSDDPNGSPVAWAEAHFIDHGNVEYIPLTWFCELPNKYKNFPGKSHACSLYGISPPMRAASFRSVSI